MAQVPIGTIILWHTETPPNGWCLCDGTLGSPDLRGSFPMGASVDGDLGVSSGANTHGHTNPSTVTNGGIHGHDNVSMSSGSGGTTLVVSGTGDSCASSGHTHGYTSAIGDSTAHSDHSLSAPADANNLPLHIKLYYIYRWD